MKAPRDRALGQVARAFIEGRWKVSVNQQAIPATVTAPSASQLGQVASVRGSRISVGLARRATPHASRATVGNFMGIRTARSFLAGVITDVSANSRSVAEEQGHYATAHVDLVGEINDYGTPSAEFRRGVTEYPAIDDPVFEIEARELQLIFNVAGTSVLDIGSLQQNESIGAYIDVDEMLTKHFAILGTTGVGKTSAVALTLQALLGKRPELRIFILDVHNEYRRCFVDRAQILNPPNLRLPFWLFSFDELVDVLFSGRPGPDEEIDILSELIPLAKAAYQQNRQQMERAAGKRGEKAIRFTVDTPVPYRVSDLISLLNERVGKLENRSSRLTYSRLINRIETVIDDGRYAFMFENANVGGDTMADVLAQLFRLRPGEQPMTIMQLAGFPSEVVDAVVSVVCRLAFDFGLWSEGAVPLLFVCEEAHRYASADRNVGFAPTRRAISRIAKEGRKYGVYLGLVTQRPAELDPTILSQCSTIFAMRMTNDRDQAILRSAVSDTTADLLDFLPALATAEVFAFGEGVALPARIKLKSLPAHQLPRSEAIANVRDRFGADVDQNFIVSVLDRWRTATSASKSGLEEAKQEIRQANAREAQPQVPAPSIEPDRAAAPKRTLVNRTDLYAAIKGAVPGTHGR
jgi:hypothetical protein